MTNSEKTYKIKVDQSKWMIRHEDAYVYFTNPVTKNRLSFKKSLWSLFETQKDREFVWDAMDKSFFTIDELNRLSILNWFMHKEAKKLKIYISK